MVIGADGVACPKCVGGNDAPSAAAQPVAYGGDAVFGRCRCL